MRLRPCGDRDPLPRKRGAAFVPIQGSGIDLCTVASRGRPANDLPVSVEEESLVTICRSIGRSVFDHVIVP